MADNDDELTRRQSHFNEQRASLRSDTSASSSNPRSRSRHESQQSYRKGLPRTTEDFDLLSDRADSETLPSRVGSPAPTPVVPRIRPETIASREKEKSRSKRSSAGIDSVSSGSKLRTGAASNGRNARDRLRVALWEELDFLASPPPDLPSFSISGFHYERANFESNESSSSNLAQASRLAGPRTPTKSRSQHPSPFDRSNTSDSPQSQANITALPVMTDAAHQQLSEADTYHQSFATPKAQRTSRLLTELYTISFLVFFAIWGTLARLGLQALTFYPGAPVVFSELWANVAGTFVMGFLSEDMRLFREEWGSGSGVVASEVPRDQPAEEGQQELEKQWVVDKKSHGKAKKTIPLYIGLTTGFCGSFTSFSSFIRDVFLGLSNDLPAPTYHRSPTAAPTDSLAPRAAGYSVMALLGVILITIALCLCALKAGAHLAASMDPVTPTLPFRHTRKIVDPLFVLLGLGSWLGAVLLAALPPHAAWRGQALFACVFAPLGCLARYYVSLLLNPKNPSFPLGTFACNMFGTAVLGMAYDLQRVAIGGVAGGGVVGCQVLQGVEDGFCGALTTVSTWMGELVALRRGRAYVYGVGSVAAGVSLMVAVMGSVRWSVGWEAVACAT